MHPSPTLAAPDYSKLHHFTSGSMTSLTSSAFSAPAPSSSTTTKPISCPPTPSHSQQQQQHFCSHCSPNKNQSFMNTQHPHHHGSSDHTHVESHASHVTTGYRGVSGGYVVSSSPTKNPSLSPPSSSRSVQGSGGLQAGQGGRAVSPSPSFVTSYKPGPSLSTKFVDRDCSLSESSFTESCTNFNHEPTSLQSNV